MTRGRRIAEAVLLIAVGAIAVATAGCGACEPEPKPLAEEAAASSARVQVSSTPPAPVLPPGHDRSANRFRASCHAIAVEGEVLSLASVDSSSPPEAGAGTVLTASSDIPSDGWLALAPGARLVVRDPRSGRETTFDGPARVRACVASREESWVSRGRFESTVGSGEAPGAEQWIVTPWAVVRFGAAKLAVDVGAKDARVSVLRGTAFAWLAPDATSEGLDGGAAPKAGDEGWGRVGTEGAILSAKRGHPPLQAARASVAACTGLSMSAQKLATAMLSRDAARENEKESDNDAGPGQAAQASQQVTTRRLARAACAVAALRVADLPATLSEGPATRSLRQTLDATLRDDERAWSELPVDPTRQAREEPP